MLHVGCGTRRLEGWTNADRYPPDGLVDLAWDVADPLPLPSGSIAYIYSEHFMEHLPLPLVQVFLQQCLRLLRPGGVLRIAMPSLRTIVGQYLSDDWRDQEWLRRPENAHIQTGCAMLNEAMRGWGHCWLYDEEELSRFLRQAGFSQIENPAPNESAHPPLRDLESRPDSLLLSEATKDLSPLPRS
jgi:predicted SAM-dependent methyltransferase